MWPGHERPVRAAAFNGGQGRATASRASVLANRSEHRMEEVKASM
jgi:hypothetical protein